MRAWLQQSPRYQGAADCFNVLPANGTIATAIEAVRNPIRENEEFVSIKYAGLPPDWKRAAAAVCWWRHRRQLMTVDDEPFPGRVNAISWTGGDGLEDVPVLAIVPGASLNVGPREIRYPKINDSPNGRFARGPKIQTGRHARRCIDDNDAMADKRWKDRPHPHHTEQQPQ
jgi:hypothetical protein